jgi:inorganic pyrophosphatase
MIDEGEADWKVVTIDAEDKWAPFLNDIDDVEKHLPGTLSAIREWFRTYKIPDGKPPVSAPPSHMSTIFVKLAFIYSLSLSPMC